jgi:hypothetical protein
MRPEVSGPDEKGLRVGKIGAGLIFGPAWAQDQGMSPIPTPLTLDEWAGRCADRLYALMRDDSVDRDDLVVMALAMAQEPAYRSLTPEAAAEKQYRDEA